MNRLSLENTKANSKTDNAQATANSSGATANTILANGRMGRRLAVGTGDLRKERVIWESGEMVK